LLAAEDDEKLLYKTILREIRTDSYDVLLPLSDTTMDLVTENTEEFKKHVRLPVPSREAFIQAYDKQNTMRICMENDIPCPRTKMDSESLDHFIQAVGFPIVAKPRMACGSMGLKIVKSREQLDHLIESTTIIPSRYVLQEFIPQTGRQFNVHLFMNNQGETTANLVTEKCRWFPIDGGASCMCRTIKDEQIQNYCEKLLKIMGWRSYCDVDLIMDPRDKIPKVLEVNGRASANIKICNLSGINIAEQMLQLAYAQPIEPLMPKKYDIRMRCLHTDLLWLFKAPDRFTRKPYWFSCVRTHDQIFSLRDPMPFFAFTLQSIPRYRREMKKRART
jgi:predicted ATP-grasp superfamily ATP-dependent carboligase